MDRTIKGRIIYKGEASGEVLKSDDPVGFFGHLDPDTGMYRESGHPLDGKCVKGKILAFPRAKGSTVGSYVVYALTKTGQAPAAMVIGECDTIVAVGAIIGEVPTVDGINISALKDGSAVRVRDGEVIVEEG
ncbi:aconitase X swivel domain-containing protein [Elusimicrobiota bacterium]